MAFLARLFRSLGINRTAGRAVSVRPRARPALEALEDRCVPSVAGFTAIDANFNGTAVPAGDSVWFSSVLKTNGLGASAVTLHFTNQKITFKVNGTTETVKVPDATVTYSPTATSASTSFDKATDSWVTTLPLHLRGNGFMDGVALTVPNGLPGRIKDVTWQGQFASDTAGVRVEWKWAAAVYTHFSTDYSTLNVKPVDGHRGSQFKNADHAGTPESFKTFLTAGARGDGHKNYTGSYSETESVKVPKVTTPPAALSGVVTDGAGHPISGVALSLSQTVNGQTVVVATATTAADGSYSFKDLKPGTYTLTQAPPPPPAGLTESTTQHVGTVNGTTDGSRGTNSNVIGGINLASGNSGVNYNFNDVFAGS